MGSCKTLLGCWVPFVLSSMLVACAQGNDGDFEFGEGSDGGVGGEGSSGSETGAASSGQLGQMTASGSESGGDDENATGDETTGGDSSGELVEPCGAVDLLLVVDNSTGMLEEQIRLQGTLNAFVQGIGTSLPEIASNVNIAVLRTDDPEFVAPVGGTYASAERFMTLASTTPEELMAAVMLGEGGHPDERPAQRVLEAFADENIAPGGANHGFLREEALLVVLIVTDEEDDLEPATQWGSDGEPEQWAEQLAAVKGGHANDVVVLSIVGTEEEDHCDAEVATRLISLADAFPRSAVGNVCEQEYASFLLDQHALLAEACANFTPP